MKYTKEEIQFILESVTTENIQVTETSSNDFSFEYDSKVYTLNPKTGLLRSNDPNAQILNRMIQGYQRAATKQFIELYKMSNAGV